MTALERVEAEAAELALTVENKAAIMAHPLRALPQRLRPDAFRVWLCHQHLKGLETPTPIVCAISVWMHNDGLTAEDASACLRAMLHPMRMGSFEFSSNLMTALAKEVEEALRRRRIERDNDESRRRMEEAKANAATSEEIARLRAEHGLKKRETVIDLGGIGRMPDEGSKT